MTRTRRCLLTCALVAATAAGVVARQGAKTVTLHNLGAFDILYVLSGGGLNAVALMQDDGVVLIDPLPVGWGQATMEAIQAVSDQPVRTIVNVRAGDEYLKANAEYPQATRIVAHRAVAERAARAGIFAGAAAVAAPNLLVLDRLTLLEGPDRMELRHFGRGVTDGDLVVVFPEKRTIYLSDLFPAKAVPTVDRARGGSVVALPVTLAAILKEVTGIRQVVAGREAPRPGETGVAKPGAVMPITLAMAWKDLQEYGDFTRDLVAAAQAGLTAGQAPAAAASWLRLPERYKAYALTSAGAAVEVIQAEISGR